MDFGYTNDESRLQAARIWRDAAIADGWSARPTYDDHESQDRACSLEREGFVVQVLTRVMKPDSRWKYQVSISVWGPDTLAIVPPDTYDWGAILAATRHCNYCRKDGVDTQRVGFAGRCCAACLPAQRKVSERPGWDL